MELGRIHHVLGIQDVVPGKNGCGSPIQPSKVSRLKLWAQLISLRYVLLHIIIDDELSLYHILLSFFFSKNFKLFHLIRTEFTLLYPQTSKFTTSFDLNKTCYTYMISY